MIRASGSGVPRRYLGLDLAGAKNQKTALAALEYYPKEQKIFLLDIYDRISAHDEQTGDDALLETIEELKTGVAKLGVNVPLSLPPCITCTRKTCPRSEKCSVPAVKWMRDLTRKAQRSLGKSIRVKEFTPYTQRPIELWVRYQILPALSPAHRMEIDEALGGSRAPLTARMHFLKRHLDDIELVEVWPKLSVSLLAQELGIQKRTLSHYRRLEEGVHARAEILETLVEKKGVFIYDRDLKKLAESLPAFDAFFCAYTAYLDDTDQTVKPHSSFPLSSGWLAYPKTGS